MIQKEFPQPEKKRKRKTNTEDSKPKVKKDTTAYHVVKFIEAIMDILDTQNKKGALIVMDNCRIHHSDFVIEAIKKHGYKPIFLPPYSSFLNPIEECWVKVQKNTRASIKVDQLTTRIAAACATDIQKHFGIDVYQKNFCYVNKSKYICKESEYEHNKSLIFFIAKSENQLLLV